MSATVQCDNQRGVAVEPLAGQGEGGEVARMIAAQWVHTPRARRLSRLRDHGRRPHQAADMAYDDATIRPQHISPPRYGRYALAHAQCEAAALRAIAGLGQ